MKSLKKSLFFGSQIPNLLKRKNWTEKNTSKSPNIPQKIKSIKQKLNLKKKGLKLRLAFYIYSPSFPPNPFHFFIILFKQTTTPALI